MLVPSLFDSFFAPTRVIVVSEERLKQAEKEARQQQLDALDQRIAELTDYRISLYNQLNPAPEPMTIERGAVGKDMDKIGGDVNV